MRNFETTNNEKHAFEKLTKNRLYKLIIYLYRRLICSAAYSVPGCLFTCKVYASPVGTPKPTAQVSSCGCRRITVHCRIRHTPFYYLIKNKCRWIWEISIQFVLLLHQVVLIVGPNSAWLSLHFSCPVYFPSVSLLDFTFYTAFQWLSHPVEMTRIVARTAQIAQVCDPTSNTMQIARVVGISSQFHFLDDTSKGFGTRQYDSWHHIHRADSTGVRSASMAPCR